MYTGARSSSAHSARKPGIDPILRSRLVGSQRGAPGSSASSRPNCAQNVHPHPIVRCTFRAQAGHRSQPMTSSGRVTPGHPGASASSRPDCAQNVHLLPIVRCTFRAQAELRSYPPASSDRVTPEYPGFRPGAVRGQARPGPGSAHDVHPSHPPGCTFRALGPSAGGALTPRNLETRRTDEAATSAADEQGRRRGDSSTLTGMQSMALMMMGRSSWLCRLPSAISAWPPTQLRR